MNKSPTWYTIAGVLWLALGAYYGYEASALPIAGAIIVGGIGVMLGLFIGTAALVRAWELHTEGR